MTNGWQTRPLGELGAFRNGINYTKSSKGESVRVIGVKDFQSNYWAPLDNLETVTVDGVLPESDVLKENDLLFVRSNGNINLIGRCVLVGTVKEKIAHSGFTIRVRLNPVEVAPEYLCHFLKSEHVRSEMIDGGIGTNIKSLNQTTLSALRVPLPPLHEQRRIIGILDEAFDGIATAKANAERNLQNARALFESHLQALFTQRGEEWVEKSVGELVAESALVKPFDGNHGEIHPRKADYTESGVPFIMACDLKNGSVDTEKCTFISRKLADTLRVGFAKDGDVLISHKGTIGRSAVVSTEKVYIMLTPQVTSYRIKDASKLFNRFIRYYFMSPVFQREMSAGAADGSTRAYMGITKQLSLRFRFPALAEQKRIAAELDVLDPETQRLASLYQQKLDALDRLKKSLLHHAFSGQL